jgi:hypothetical protein
MAEKILKILAVFCCAYLGIAIALAGVVAFIFIFPFAMLAYLVGLVGMSCRHSAVSQNLMRAA